MSGPTPVLVNRRGEERVALRCPLDLLGTRHGKLRGQLVNISAGGALLALPCDVPLGVELAVRIDLPDGQPPLEARVIALRQERGPTGAPPVKVGVSFILPSAEVVTRIRTLIYGS